MSGTCAKRGFAARGHRVPQLLERCLQSIAVALSTDAVADALCEVGYDASDVVEVGAGAWSSCFAFRADGRDLVVRFGPYVEDFQKDRFAARFSCAAMPVPSVEVIRSAGDGFLAVSTRVPGIALEEVTGSEWERLVPAIVELLEALRTTEIPDGGFGGWDGTGIAGDASWRDHLLAVRFSTGDRRPLDWYERLGDRPTVRAAFDDGSAAWGRWICLRRRVR